MAAANLVYAARLPEGRARAGKMLRSKDADEKACGLWLQATMTEMELALLDTPPEKMWDLMEKRLDAMEAFGKEYSETRFSDLILEAMLRRVRLWVERDEQTKAVMAAKAAHEVLKRRRRIKKPTPTYFYAEAVTNLAISHADWAIRVVLRLIGLEADDARGKKAMQILLRRPRVYQAEARAVARSFALQGGGVLESPLRYSKASHEAFPSNPQLAFDLATDLTAAGRCDEVSRTLAPMKPKLKTLSNKLRTKLERALQTCR